MIKVLTTRQLKRQDIFQICNLKNTYWRFSLDKQIQWFEKNIKNDEPKFKTFKKIEKNWIFIVSKKTYKLLQKIKMEISEKLKL